MGGDVVTNAAPTTTRPAQRRKASRWTQQDLLDIAKRVRGVRPMTEMRDSPAEKGERRGQKYGNTKVEDQGATFDSKAEHKRWVYLQMLQRAGEITELERQVPFELIPAQVAPSGAKHRPTAYLADFVYRDKAGARIVEDVKGAVTPEFRLKRKLMLHVHGIEIQEVRS